MKNIDIKRYLIIAVIACVVFTSCEVLEQTPEGLIPSELAITDLGSAQSAVTGIYDGLQSGDLYGGRFILATEMTAGNARAAAFQAFWQELESGIVSTANAHVESNYVEFYAAINTANHVITKVPDLNISDEDRDQLLGEAYFLRGLAYFDLLRQYGEFDDLNSAYGIAIRLEPAELIEETSRSSVAESYNRIEQDLQQAIDLLPSGANKFVASKGAAQALKARVHLYKSEFELAESLANNVISSGTYALSDNYNGIYLNEGSEESIFELDFIQANDPNAWSIEMYISPPEVTVSDAMIDFISSEPERGQLFEQVGNFVRCTKYGSEPTDEGTNTIILRLSEMYLIRAEASARKPGGILTDALADINFVRNRAGLPNLTAANVSSESDLIDVLMRERRAEFAFEGHYWFDLARYGRFEAETGMENFRRIFPIPQREMNITNGTLEQNPQYN